MSKLDLAFEVAVLLLLSMAGEFGYPVPPGPSSLRTSYESHCRTGNYV